MADTPELLRLCERVIAEGSRVAAYMNYERDTVPDWHKDVAIPSVVLPIARALKSRLQAEAQAPTTAPGGPDEYMCGTCGAQWFDGIQQDCGHRKYELAYFKPSPCKAVRAALDAGPVVTTAAPVLTEDERRFLARSDHEAFNCPRATHERLRAIIDRLTSTVGASAESLPSDCPERGEHVEFKFDASLDKRAVVGAPAP